MPNRDARTMTPTYLALALANAAEAVEVLSVGFLLPQIDVNTFASTALAAAVFVGMLLGGLVGGLADSIGRSRTLTVALGLSTLAMAASSLSPGVVVLIVCRMLSGIGVGASTPPLFSLAVELAPSGRSGQAVALVASFWMVGSIVVAGLAYATFGTEPTQPSDPVTSWAWSAGWRRFAIASAGLPAIATIMTALFVRDVHVETPDRPQNTSTMDVGGAASGAHAYCAAFEKLFSGQARGSLLALVLAWFGLNFGYYGLATWVTIVLSDFSPTLANNKYAVAFLYAGGNLPGNIASFLLVERVGRRRLLVAAMALSAGCTLALSLADRPGANGGHVGNHDDGIRGAGSREVSPSTIIALAVAFNGCATAGWNALDALSAETFPAPVRATAFGLLTCAGRIASIVAQIVNGSLAKNASVLFGVTSSLMLLGCAGAACLREPNLLDPESNHLLHRNH